MKTLLKLLLLEDDPLDAELNIAALEDEDFQCEWKRVQTKDEFIAALEKPAYDLILIDYTLPAFDGMSALHILRDHNLNIPALLVSGNLGEELAIDSIKAGAVDYVHKDRLNRLAPSVKRALQEYKLRNTEREQANNLALFSKLNQAANSGLGIRELFKMLAVETSLYDNYFGATVFLLSEDQEYFEMQYLALPANMRKKLEVLIKDSIPKVRIKVVTQKKMRKTLESKKIQLLDNQEELDTFLFKFIQEITPENLIFPLKKLVSQVGQLLSLKSIAFLPLATENQKVGVLVFPYKEHISAHHIQRMESIAEQLTEIFARKLAEEKVEKLHHQQKLILDSADEGILGVDLEGGITFINPSATVMLGYTEEEMLGKYCHNIFHFKKKNRQPYPKEKCPIYATYTFGENVYEGNTDFFHKNGNSFPVLYSSAVIEEAGKRVGAVITFRNISEQIEATRKIARLAEVVKQASVTVAITDLEGDLVYANPFFEESSGYSLEEALGNNPRVLKSDFQDEAFYKNLWDTITSGETWRDVFVNKRKDGSLYYEDAHIFPIKTDDGEIINYAAVKRDITSQVKAEEQIRLQLSRLDSLHSIDVEILTNIDLNTILDVVLKQVQNGLGIDAANILLFNSSLQSLQYTAQVGFKRDKLSYKYLRLGKGLAGKTALERKTTYIKDLSKESDFLAETPELISENFISYFGLPLLAQGKLKGVLEVFHRTPLDPDIEWLKFLDMLAGQAAIAIENISLFEFLQKSNTELRLAYDTTLEGWARALELRDMETEGHSRRVTDLTTELATAMGTDPRMLDHIRRGALLHDIGKMGIPDAILNKPGPLTDIEWTVMKKHPVFAYDMLREIVFLKPAIDIPYCHHEKWDGSGYPLGMHGEGIPLAARVFAVVDVYDALTSTRTYRKAWSVEKTLAHIQENSGTHFDPQIVDMFMKIMSKKDGD